MTAIVIDSSYALACMMPDERRPDSMDTVLGEVLLAPFIWPIEIASAMRNCVRLKRFDVAQAIALATHVTGLDARVAAPWHNEASRYLELALAHELTPYDAIYIDLCLSEHSALATCDRELSLVAARLGIRIHS
ncbi:MAG TPA: type II toxin-antitoxin system VapC family toxin [Caldimonas sp.]